MTDRQILIAYLIATGLCALYILVQSVVSKRSRTTSSGPRRVAGSYLTVVFEIPVAIAVALMWPLGLLAFGLYGILRALGVQPRSEREKA